MSNARICKVLGIEIDEHSNRIRTLAQKVGVSYDGHLLYCCGGNPNGAYRFLFSTQGYMDVVILFGRTVYAGSNPVHRISIGTLYIWWSLWNDTTHRGTAGG